MELAVKKTSKEAYSVILKDLSSYGGFPFYGIVTVVYSLLREFQFAYDLAASLIIITLIVAGIRLAYFKPRPGMPRKKYNSIYERIDNSSFPSIHAARAVMLSLAFYSRMPSLLPVFVLLTIAVLLSRLYFKRHDLLDLAVGSAIGLGLGYFFFIL